MNKFFSISHQPSAISVLLIAICYLLSPISHLPAHAQTNVSLLLSVTNITALTNADAAATFTLRGSTLYWTNATPAQLLLRPSHIPATNTTARAATNLFNKLTNTFGSGFFFSYASSTSLVIRAPINTTLIASANTNWASLSFSTNYITSTNLTGTVSGSNITALALTLGGIGGQTINSWDDVTNYFAQTGSGSGADLRFTSSSGTITAGSNTFAATQFSGGGASLTALNASSLASGTVDDARLPNSITSDITGNAATATTASLVSATGNGVMTNDTRQITFSNRVQVASLGFTNMTLVGTQVCVTVYSDDTNNIYDVLSGTTQARGRYTWATVKNAYTNGASYGVYFDGSDYYLTNAAGTELYTGTGLTGSGYWSETSGDSPPPTFVYGTNTATYCTNYVTSLNGMVQFPTTTTNTLYVSKLGNDLFARRGDPFRSWLTVGAAMTNATQGDIISIGPGEYNTGLYEQYIVPGVSIIGCGPVLTRLNGDIIAIGGSNVLWKDFHYDGVSEGGYIRVQGTNVVLDTLKIVGEQDGIYLRGFDNLIGRDLDITSNWDCIADYQWETKQSSNSIAEFYNCKLYSTYSSSVGFAPTCVSVGASILRFYGGSMIASNGTAGNTRVFYAQAGGVAAAHLGRVTISDVSMLASSTNGAAYSLYWQTNGNIHISGSHVPSSKISGSPTITYTDASDYAQTNFVLNTVYTNGSGKNLIVKAKTGLNVAAISGRASLKLMTKETPGGSFTDTGSHEIGTSVATLTMGYTNVVSDIIPPNGAYYWTNASVGAGNEATIISGSGKTLYTP